MPTPPTTPPDRPAPPSPLRARVERLSLPLLLRLTRLPRAVPFVLLLAALVVALLVEGPVGVLLTAAVTLFVGWLAYLGWPRLGAAERLGRVAVLFLAAALCVTQAFPR